MHKLSSISKLILSKTRKVVDAEQEKLRSKLFLTFQGYNKIIVEALKSSGYFDYVKTEAEVFRHQNPHLYSSEEANLRKEATEHISQLGSVVFHSVEQTLSKNKSFFNLNFDYIKKIYNFGGYSQVVSAIAHSKLNQKIKKDISENSDQLDESTPPMIDFQISDIVGDFSFDLKDKQILNKLEEKAQELSYTTDIAYATIYSILVTDLYIMGTDTNTAVSDVESALNNFSANRSDFISEYDSQLALDMAAKDVAQKMNLTMKSWVDMHDNRVRGQHRLNSAGGPRKINESFAGGPREYSPTDCESPWRCRCYIAVYSDQNSPIKLIWGGNEVFSI